MLELLGRPRGLGDKIGGGITTSSDDIWLDLRESALFGLLDRVLAGCTVVDSSS